jgi:pantothenate kinase
MDGYHLTRLQLSQLPNSEEAIFRRGAAFTFNSSSYFSLIKELRKPLSKPTLSEQGGIEEGIIYAPSFDHALKDPIENDIAVPPTSRILLIEGLYLSLSSPFLSNPKENYTPPNPPHSPEWSQAGDLIDEHWFIETDFEKAAKRLVKRHLASGICESEEVARQRVWESDLRNGREIVEGRRRFRGGVDVIVRSREDEGWR